MQFLVILNANRKIRKRTDTDVAVTPQCYGCIKHVHSMSIIIYSKHP